MAENEIDSQSWKIMQIGVVVRDREKTVKLLEALGFGPFETRILPPDREEWYRGKPFKASASISMAKWGDVQLELIEPPPGESVHKEFLDSKGEGIQHVMFAVDDFAKEVKALTEKGAEIVLQAKMPGGRQIAYVDLKAADIVVELVQKQK
jgi:methylmalonyl-CoA/ethylmalonyl-CoA epimerase